MKSHITSVSEGYFDLWGRGYENRMLVENIFSLQVNIAFCNNQKWEATVGLWIGITSGVWKNTPCVRKRRANKS
jgi:hypothetical protein